MSIIIVENVTKEYKLGQLKSLKHTFLDTLGRLGGRTVPRQQPFKALDDVSFSVEAGEVLGIIGTNGAGKSTMLKLLAKISTPTRGNVKVKGSVAPLIEVGAGLIGDLTGRENIYVNGAILGLSRVTIRKKFDEIVEFAELEEFIDTPVKRYSSGMAVLLGFSLATCVDSDILIVDEVLAVGDLAFQRKCFDRMEELIKRRGKVVLLVSHNIRQVERICSRVILLDHGKIFAEGHPHKICKLFYEQSDEKIKSLSANNANINNSSILSDEFEMLDISIINNNGQSINRVFYKSDICISIKCKVKARLNDVTFGVGVHTTDFLYLSTHNTEQQLLIDYLLPGEHEILCRISQFPLLPGVYALRVGVATGKAGRSVFYGENLLNFQVVTSNDINLPITLTEGFFVLDAKWDICGTNTNKITIK
jgi:ABC-type polysaccharide/polyol phosphate transport system ATPase subunit